LFAINLLMLPSQLNAVEADYIKFNFGFLLTFWRTLQNFLFSFNIADLAVLIKRIIIITYALFLIFSFKKLSLNFKSLIQEFNSIILLLIISLFVFFSIIILVIVFKVDYIDRYMSLLYPALFLLFIFSLTLIKKYYFIWAIVLFLFYGFTDFSAYSRFVKHYDYKMTARYIEKIEKENEPILFYLSAHALPFQYYYKGSNKIIPLPEPIKFNNPGYYKNVFIPDTAFLNKTFNNDLKDYKSFIFISDNIYLILGRTTNKQMIDSFLVSRFNSTIDTTVQGGAKKNNFFRIRRLIRK
jgi:hypothetical protein